MPKVSVIIPAYNAETTIEMTVASVCSQFMTDWEAIVVDDGSTDRTAERVAQIKDARIRTVRQANSGASAARNRGLELANAPYVLFLDADDTIKPRHLANLLAAANGRENVVAYSGYRRVTSDNTPLEATFAEEIGEQPYLAFSFTNKLAIHCLLIPQAAFACVGTFDPTLPTCEDWDLWARLARAGFVFKPVASATAIYRMRNASLSRDFELLADNAYEVLGRCRQHDPRVKSIYCEFAEGYPGDLRSAFAHFLLWCTTAAFASGQELALPFDRVEGVDLAGEAGGLVATLKDGLAVGSEGEPGALARVWARIRNKVAPALEHLTAHSSEAGLRHQVVYRLERDLVRADNLTSPLQLECVQGLRRDIEDLQPVTTTADLVHLRICSGSEEKLRQELPGLSGQDRAAIEQRTVETIAKLPAPPRKGAAEPQSCPTPQIKRHNQLPPEAARTIPILMYRSIEDRAGSGNPRSSVTPAALEAQLRLLRHHGFQSLNSSAFDWHRQNRVPVSSRAVMITFDGGYQDFHRAAWPILNRNGFSADVFVPAGKIGESADWDRTPGNPRLVMEWQEIAELNARGIGFGTQLMSHRHVDSLTSAEMLEEALRSRLILERALGQEVRTLAAPWGGLDERAIRIFHAAGYHLCYSTRGGLASIDEHSLNLPRIEIRGDITLDEFAAALGLPCQN